MADIRNLTIVRETEKALLLKQTIRHETIAEVWVPKSQMDYIKRHPKSPDGSQQCDNKIPDWLADEKGFNE